MVARLLDETARPRNPDALDTPLAKRVVEYVDSNGGKTGKLGFQARVYNPGGGALVKGQPYMIAYTGSPATSPGVIAPATSTPARQVVVAAEAIPAASWGWVYYAGWCDALVNGTTDVAVGDYLKITSGTSTTSFIKDGATYSVNSLACAGAASTADSDNTTLIELLGEKGIVA